METEKISVINLLAKNDENIIKNGLLKLKGVIDVIVKPEKFEVEVTYENMKRVKIINRLFSLGYFEDK